MYLCSNYIIDVFYQKEIDASGACVGLPPHKRKFVGETTLSLYR
ncbi:hypothetical protein [Thermoflexibacter ruber]|nr:hypothetical protein [Thermoflexibacter ruber]